MTRRRCCVLLYLLQASIHSHVLHRPDKSSDMQVVNIGASGEAFEVRARGELQLGLLLGASSMPKRSSNGSGQLQA